MSKILTKYIDQDSLKASLVFALTYCLMFNSSVFWYKATHYNQGVLSLTWLILKDFALITMALFFFFFGLALHRLLFQIITILLFLGGAFASYHLYIYQSNLSKRLITSLYGNDLLEAYKHLDIKLLVWMVFSMGVYYLAVIHFKIKAPVTFFHKLLCGICLFLFVNCILAPPFGFIEDYFPTQFLTAILER